MGSPNPRLFCLFAIFLLVASANFAQTGNAEIIKVIETYPLNNQLDVSPNLLEIKIKFNSPMNIKSYSIVEAGEGETPDITGNPQFRDAYTCIIPVKLKPNTLYSLGINSQTRKGFVGQNGIPAEPYVLTFKTAGDGKTQPCKDSSESAQGHNIETIQQPSKKASVNKEKIIVYNFYLEKTRGAFWLLVPTNWKVDGGISEALFQSPKIDLRVAHPEGWAYIQYIPGARYMPINQFRPPGSVDQYGNVYMPYMEPITYLRNLVVPRLYPGSQIKEINARELPEVAQILKRFYDLIGIIIPQVKVAELSLETTKNGRTYFDRLIVYFLITPVMQDIVWETQIVQISALKEKLSEVEPILMTTLASFQLNPNWLLAVNRAEQVRGEIRMRYQQEILEIQDRMYKNRVMVNDEISRSIGLELSDQAQFVDPKTGEVRTLISSYDKTWTNGNGTFFQTNDPNLNPNDPAVQNELGLSGDFRLMTRK